MSLNLVFLGSVYIFLPQTRRHMMTFLYSWPSFIPGTDAILLENCIVKCLIEYIFLNIQSSSHVTLKCDQRAIHSTLMFIQGLTAK